MNIVLLIILSDTDSNVLSVSLVNQSAVTSEMTTLKVSSDPVFQP